MARFTKGKPRPPNAGRKPGSPNRVNVAVKTAILEALNSGDGATAFFQRLKDSRSAEDRRCFAAICARLLPRTIEGDLSIDAPPRGIVHVYVPSNGRGPPKGGSGN